METSEYLPRLCRIQEALRRKSVLFLGPRRTGKTQYVRHELKPDRIYNLLSNAEFSRLSANPGLIREELKERDKLVVVDEIQKLPSLMDEVHDLIESTDVRFLLTGSSARKLRRSHTGLMAGRLRPQRLWPFVSRELTKRAHPFDLERALTFGTIPPVFFSETPAEELSDYTGAYLKEEIQAEAITRRIENFSRFLRVAALSNSELINFASIGRDAGVPPRTVMEYFHVLEDTLIGTMLPPWKSAKSRKSYSMSKFYFFDVGVANSLAGVSAVPRGTSLYGKAFEQFLYLELKAYRDYCGKNQPLSFWRSYDGHEVDFIIGDEIAIEAKAAPLLQKAPLKNLQRLSEEGRLRRKIVISQDPRSRRIGDIEILPIEDFLERLWNGEIF